MEQNNWQAKDAYKMQTTSDEEKFIFDQAEKKLKEVTKSSEQAIARSINIISIIVGILVGLISFTATQYLKTGFTSFIGMVVSGSGYLFVILLYISKNIKGIEHSTIGTAPKLFMTDGFFNQGISKELRAKMMIWSEIENYQDSINANKASAERLWRCYNKSLRLFIATPLVLTVSFFLIRYFI